MVAGAVFYRFDFGDRTPLCQICSGIGAIVAISAIHLLKTFMEIPDEPSPENVDMYLWKVVIHMAFVLSGVLFAMMDRIAAETKSH